MGETSVLTGYPSHCAIINTKPKQLICSHIFDKQYEFWLTYVPFPTDLTSKDSTLQTTNLQDEAVFNKFVELCAQRLKTRLRNEDGSLNEKEFAVYSSIQAEFKGYYEDEIEKIRPIESGAAYSGSFFRFSNF